MLWSRGVTCHWGRWLVSIQPPKTSLSCVLILVPTAETVRLICASLSPPYTQIHTHTHHTHKHWLILQPLLSQFKALFIVSLKVNIQDDVSCCQGQKRQQEVAIISKDMSDNKTCLLFSKAKTGSHVRVLRFTYSEKRGHMCCFTIIAVFFLLFTVWGRHVLWDCEMISSSALTQRTCMLLCFQNCENRM